MNARSEDTIVSGFAYTAEQFDGTPVRGSVEADTPAAAEAQLQSMGLRVLELRPVSPPARPVRLGTADVQAFNEFLLQISRAGLPVEGGLAALSHDLGRGPLKRAVEGLTQDLHNGVPLEKAVAQRRRGLPPLYGHLIDAGVQSGDLPAVLGRFGRHAQTVADLRQNLWRATAYPAVVLVALLLLLSFLGYFVLPNYFAMIQTMAKKDIAPMYGMFSLGPPGPKPDPGIPLPMIAWAMLYVGKAAPFLLAGGVAAALGLGVLYRVLRAGGRERGLVDAMSRLPLVGRAVRDSHTASWLDVASIGASAGLDLPRALKLAGDAVALPSVSRDTTALVERLESGHTVVGVKLARLPATVPLAIDLSDGPGRLPATLRGMADQFEQQARRQIAMVPGRVMPALLVVIGLLAGGILYSLWMPMAYVLGSLTGP